MEITLHRGKPAIRFRHHDKKDTLEQLAIKAFVDGAKKHGVKLGYGSGHLNTGTGESWEDYFILIDQDTAPEPTSK